MIWEHALQFLSVSLLKCLCMQILILNSKDMIVYSEIKFEWLCPENTCFFKILQILRSDSEEVSGICIVI